MCKVLLKSYLINAHLHFNFECNQLYVIVRNQTNPSEEKIEPVVSAAPSLVNLGKSLIYRNWFSKVFQVFTIDIMTLTGLKNRESLVIAPRVQLV